MLKVWLKRIHDAFVDALLVFFFAVLLVYLPLLMVEVVGDEYRIFCSEIKDRPGWLECFSIANDDTNIVIVGYRIEGQHPVILRDKYD